MITWTPTEAQGPVTNTLTTVVSDGALSATNSFTVTVTEVNVAPVLPAQTNRTMAELTLLTVTNTATDSDLPANTLTYQLLSPPSGAAISASGVITWTPTEVQGPVTNTLTTVVSDGALSATNSFTVTVTEVNVAPVLPAQTNRTMAELTLLTVTNTATDADLPANTLTYQLLSPPSGAAISASGVITWTPTEVQGPVTNTLTTVVSDGALSATNSFTVTVTEVNVAPVLPAQTNRTMAELTLLTVTNTATDTDLPANTLTYQLLSPPSGAAISASGVITWTPTEAQGPVTTYQLLSPPSGAAISASGVITWTPTEAQGPVTNTLTTVVSDGALSATNSFTVTVTEVNLAPVLPVQTNRTIAELTSLTVTNTAMDADLPANNLTYQLLAPPGNASISASGVISWTPGESEGPGTNTLTTVVSDGQASVTNSFMVIVTELNVAPVLPVQSDRSVIELTTLTVTNAASDADLPANVLTYELLDPPSGAAIDANGVITWTPTIAQGPGTNTLTTVVNDGNASATNSFVVTVTDGNQAPVLPVQTNRTVAELTLLTVTNTATDADIPANVLTYQLLNPPSGVVITANGVITWTPTEIQGPGTNAITTVVSDGLASATNSFAVTVTEANQSPVLPVQTDRVIAELTPLSVTNTASDADLPANNLTYQLLNSPVGASISAEGVIHWAAAVTEGPSTNIFTTVVSDGSASATNSFAVTVNDTLAGTTTNITLISTGAVWNYLDNGSDQGSAWPATGFNDSGWSNGPAQLGYGDGDEQTVVGFGTNSSAKYLTTYFRRAVTIANPTGFSSLNLRLLRDDGAVVYLNGNEVYRDNLPTGPINYQTRAVSNVGGVNETNYFAATVDPAWLVAGTNVVAVEVHQDLPTSSDLSFDFELTGVLNLLPPVLPQLADLTMAELTTLTVTNTASDLDSPANTLTYQLVNAPPGAVIDANGIITWTPTEAQGPATNTITTVVSDSTASATNSFVVVVNEVNVAPVFAGAPSSQTIAELAILTVTNKASDADLPANLLSYQLLNAPGGMSISGDGVITWTPTEAQGPATNTITTVVSDGVLSATNSFTVTVTEVNVAPGLPVPTNRTMAELTALTVTNTATDPDVPANVLTYQLVNPPAGASITANGVITWTPTEAQGPVTNTLITIVSDGLASATNSFVVTVTEVNQPPVLPVQTNRTLAELTLLTVTNMATDGDLPANTLSYQLLNPPGNASISAGGVITWTPGESEGPGTNTLITVVSDGTASVTNSFLVVVTELNTAPVLPLQTNRTIAELTTLTITNTASDADLPANVLTYQLVNAPVGAVIDANGVITWTPTEAQGPVTNTLTTVVSDGALSATNSFTVSVTEVNVAPVLPVQTNRTMAELTLLTLTNTATDSDLPANTLTYQLLNAPAGAVVDANGVITWTPTEAQGPVTNTLTTVVSDGALSATNSFTVTVTEVNVVPVLPAQTNRTIAELTLLTVTNTATDSDLPANTLTYQLLSPPSGAAISASGVITWTPTEAQGPVTNTLTTVVSDGALSATNSFTVTVTEVNVAPVLPAQTNRTMAELTLLTVTNTATDTDLPANTLTYQLLNAPAGAVIDANGVITWTPTEVQGPVTNTLTTVVSDGVLSATNSFTVTVTEVNVAPVLPVQTNRTIAELTLLTVTNTATDTDLPANTLTYQLLNAPAGAVIDANGVITWTPTEAQGPVTNTLTTVVSDGALSATNSFTITVTEVNAMPSFVLTPSNTSVPELTQLMVTNRATDVDLPANALAYSLLNAPAGVLIDTNGVITWTPTEAQGPTTNTILTVVNDGFASATNSFVVIVTEMNQPPVLPVQTNRTIAELSILTVTNTASDPDLPASVLTYQLLNAPDGAVIDANGVITWTPSEAQGPATNTLTTVVSDGALSATNSFVVTVTEVNVAPVLPAQTNRTVTELTLLAVTNTAADSDLPASVLSYQLLNAPVGAVVDANGVITWTPTEAQGPGTNTLTTVVSDGSVSVTNSFQVVVTEVNVPPVFLLTPSEQVVPELVTLTVTNAATDSDLPANALTYSLVEAPIGAAIDDQGVFTWRPKENQGSSSNVIITVVSDGSVSVTNSFVVMVTEVNSPPLLSTIVNRTIHAGSTLLLHCLAQDSNGESNNLMFSFDAAPDGATINATNGQCLWLTTDANVDTTNEFIVRVTDDGVPPLSDTKSFTVIVVARPFIQDISVTNELVTVSWSAIDGQHYVLQGSPGLSPTNWSDVGGEVISAGATASQTNSISATPMQFYRVRLAQ